MKRDNALFIHYLNLHNTMGLDLTTKLASNTTISDYYRMRDTKDRIGIAEFVYTRLSERYIVPMKNVPREHKNGFSIMANCCLLIETYESFRLGIDSTYNLKEPIFQTFFDQEVEFIDFNMHSKDFYTNIRCGILHQGETKKGWKITRKSESPLFDPIDNRINANEFLQRLELVLLNYKDVLIEEGWESDNWKTCRKKIDYIIKNCTMKELYFAYGSNMSIAQLKERKVDHKYLGKAILSNYQLLFNKLANGELSVGYANIVPKENSTVEGLLFEVDNLNALDRFEGYPNHYKREVVNLSFEGNPIVAITYVAVHSKTAENLKPEKEYLNRLLSAKGKLSEGYYDGLARTETVD